MEEPHKKAVGLPFELVSVSVYEQAIKSATAGKKIVTQA